MPFTLDPDRWNAIEALPLPTGVGDKERGLCAVARIVYACTGKASDAAPPIASRRRCVRT